MELGTDMISLEMSDICNKSRVLRREPNELSKAGTTILFRDFLAILETRVKNKDRASPNMCTLKIAMVRLGLGKYFQRSQASNVIRDTIEEPDRYLEAAARSEEEMAGRQESRRIPSKREIGVAKPSTPLDPRRIHSPKFPPHNASSQAALARKPKLL
jgi:hypothetical protein